MRGVDEGSNDERGREEEVSNKRVGKRGGMMMR